MSEKDLETQSGGENQTQQTSQEEDQHTDDSNNKIDPNYVSSLEQRIAEQQIQNRRLEQLIESVKQARESSNNDNNVRTRNVEEERTQFYQDPLGTLAKRDEMILKQMERMLEPIKKVASSFQVDSEYQQLKMLVKNDPVFGKALKDPDIESMVDMVMKQPGIEVSENTFKSAIAQAMGMKALSGHVNMNTNTNTNTNMDNRNRVDPPTIPPSRTRTAAPAPKKELTEDDRLAMRIAGLKPGNPEHESQYWELISDETMVLDVHKKERK